MNYRGICKLIIIFVALISSIIFMFFTNQYLSISNLSTALLFLFIIFDYLLIIFRKKHKSFKSIYFISGVVVIITCYHLYFFIHNYILFNSLEVDASWFYLLILFLLFIDSFMDIKKKSNQLNDILTIIVCLLISFVHYRYYLEPRFIHHLTKLPDMSSFGIGLQDSYMYVTKYYLLFISILFVLFVHKKITNFHIKSE